ncbi:MAG: energy transducer TonB [Oceanicoccus sp.]|nr:energy transducer TonB [Oceanicoccus sp.]
MAGQEGWVILQYSITSSGAVRDYSVYDASPENLYDQSVLSAVERLNKLKLGAGSSDSDNEAFKAVNCRQIIRFNLGS